MIIDLSEWLKAERKEPSAEGAARTDTPPSPPQPPRPPAVVELEPHSFSACQHKSMRIDDKQRTVKCGECGIWLDPVWCLRELFRYYEQRVDQRLAAIKAFEDKHAEADKRAQERQRKPRKAKAASMQQHLERAAYNEYQAKVLTARASTQRALAGKIEAELLADPAAEPSA